MSCGLDPQLHAGAYVFATVGDGTVLDVEPVVSIVEPAGRTVVLPETDAVRLGLATAHRCARITLRRLPVHVAGALAARGIDVRPVSGVGHVHLFVPHDRAADAMDVLGAGSTRTQAGEFETDDDPDRVDRDVVWTFLVDAYWNGSRTRAQFEAQLAGSRRQIGVYRRATGELVGFARAVTDDVTFGYLADVFVLPSARGAGLGKALVEAMLAGPGRIRWVLFTKDAHELYTRYGFSPPESTCLVRRRV